MSSYLSTTVTQSSLLSMKTKQATQDKLDTCNSRTQSWTRDLLEAWLHSVLARIQMQVLVQFVHVLVITEVQAAI